MPRPRIHMIPQLPVWMVLVALWLFGAAQAHAQAPTDPARAALIERATGMAVTLEHEERRSELLQVFMRALADLGAAGEAEALARSQADAALQTSLLAELALATARNGQADLSQRLANEVAGRGGAMGDPDLQGLLARAFAVSGEPDRALSIALAIADPAARADTLNEIAPDLSGTDFFKPALDAVSRLRDSDALAEGPPLTGFLEALINAGQIETALEMIGPVAESGLTLNTVVSVGEALVRSGQVDTALDLRHSLHDPDLQDLAILRLLPALVEAGEVDRAARLAHDIIADLQTEAASADLVGKIIWLMNILPRFEPETAMRELEALIHPSMEMKHPGLLAEIGAEMALLGRDEQALSAFSAALQLASEQETLAFQSQALVTIARQLRRAGRDTSADEFLANAQALALDARPPHGDASSLVYLARAQFEADRPADALATLSDALTATEVQSSLGQFVVLRDLIELLARASRPSQD